MKVSFFIFEVLSYGRHIVFVIESRIALRTPENSLKKKENLPNKAEIRLKGQMKLMPAWNMVVFLCHPM